jgi:hypothetical protein
MHQNKDNRVKHPLLQKLLPKRRRVAEKINLDMEDEKQD